LSIRLAVHSEHLFHGSTVGLGVQTTDPLLHELHVESIRETIEHVLFDADGSDEPEHSQRPDVGCLQHFQERLGAHGRFISVLGVSLDFREAHVVGRVGVAIAHPALVDLHAGGRIDDAVDELHVVRLADGVIRPEEIVRIVRIERILREWRKIPCGRKRDMSLRMDIHRVDDEHVVAQGLLGSAIHGVDDLGCSLHGQSPFGSECDLGIYSEESGSIHSTKDKILIVFTTLI
jgi:hypothetical protein